MTNKKELSWVDSPCNGCGSKAGQNFLEGSDLLMGLPGRFQLVKCPQCGLIRQNPHLSWDSLEDYYPDNYSPYTKIIATELSAGRRLDRRYGMWKRLRTLEQFQSSGNLLDVGCGTGVFLGEAQRTGYWKLSGVEPNTQVAAYAQKTLGIPILGERFDKVELPTEHYDVITMWNVLEHLDTPVEDLYRAHSLIRPGGWLVLTIPNVDGIGAKLFGRYWMGWDLPRHLYFFSQKQLRSTLREIGFDWVDTRCIAGGHSSLDLSFIFFLKAKNLENRWTHFLLKLYRSLPVRIVLSPLFWLSDQLRQCSLITVFAQKRPTGGDVRD